MEDFSQFAVAPDQQQPESVSFDQFSQAPIQQQQPQSTGVLTQLASGISDSTASLAGLPVDAMTAVMNLGISGLNQLGTNIPIIENPVGGSQDLRTNRTANSIGNAVGVDFGNPQDVPAPQGLAENAANIVGQAIPAIATGTAAFRTLPQASGTLGTIAQGAGVGAAEGAALSQAETVGGFAGDVTLGGVGGATGGAISGLFQRLSRGGASDQRVAQLIQDGELDNRIVGREINEAGRLVSRPQDAIAQKQGFSEGVIALTRVANNDTKAKFGEIVNVVTDQQRNIVNE